MAVKAKKTALELVTSLVAKAPKKGLTANEISTRTSIPLNTVRVILGQLVKDKNASVIGVVASGSRGRPANIYGKA